MVRVRFSVSPADGYATAPLRRMWVPAFAEGEEDGLCCIFLICLPGRILRLPRVPAIPGCHAGAGATACRPPGPSIEGGPDGLREGFYSVARSGLHPGEGRHSRRKSSLLRGPRQEF